MKLWLAIGFYLTASSGVLQAAELPAQVLDLTHWKLTVPISNSASGPAAEIKQPHLATFQERNVLFVDPRSKAVIFRAPCGGVTTQGSKFPRSELREMSASDPESSASWSTADSAIYTLTATLAVTHLPDHKPHVVCAQIHDAQDDLIMVRLEGHKLFVERNKTGDVELDPDYQLGTFCNVKIAAGRGHVQVWYNGAAKMDWEISRKGCYFKAGCYTQSNVQKGDAPTAYGEVAIRKLSVTTGE